MVSLPHPHRAWGGRVAWEERPHTLVTRSHVERTWSPAERAVFDCYAYPLGGDVYVMWEKNPAAWAPQNHSCTPIRPSLD